jgi:uncharacterized protein (TIGR02147 family)
MGSSVTAGSSVASILNSALGRLRTENRQVSIRALSAQVKLTPSYLSKIFRGERSLPLKLVPPLARVLQLDHHEVAQVQRLVLQGVGVRGLSPADRAVVAEYKTYGTNEYWLLEEWYRLPILNLVTTANCDPAPSSIARRLGISVKQATESLEKLVAHGHIALSDGRYQRGERKLRFPTQRSHPSVRAFHRAMIERALLQMQGTPTEKEFAERLVSGITFAADPTRLAEARVILEEAMYRIAELLAAGECTEVFQLNAQLFSLSRTP